MVNNAFDSEVIGNSSYLVATFPNGEGLVNYQVRMLTENSIPNIIAVSRQQKNSDVQLRYNVSDKITLEKAVSDKKIPKSGILSLLAGAVRAIDEIKEYRLMSGGLIFDAQYIFVAENGFDPHFIYVPTSNVNEGLGEFKRLVKSFVVNSRLELMPNDGFVGELLEILNDPAADASAIDRFVKKHSGKRPAVADSNVNNDKRLEEERRRREEEQRARDEAERRKKAQEEENKRAAEVQQNTAPKAKSSGMTPKKLAFIILQPVLLIAVIGIVLSGVLFDENGQLMVEYIAGIAIGVLGLDFVLYREFFQNKKDGENAEKPAKTKKTSEKTVKPSGKNNGVNIPGKGVNVPGKTVNIPGKSVNTAEKDISKESTPKKELPVSETPLKNITAEYEPATELIGDDDKTDLMTDVYYEAAYLEFYENGLSVRIKLNEGVNRVGRRNFSVNNSHVSKSHAEFTARGGEYFVTDVGSANGTRINGGEKIAPGTEYPIVPGDKITLADIELELKK